MFCKGRWQYFNISSLKTRNTSRKEKGLLFSNISYKLDNILNCLRRGSGCRQPFVVSMYTHGETVLLVMFQKAVKSSLVNTVQKQERFSTYSSSVVEKRNPSSFSCCFSPSRCAHLVAVYGTVDNTQQRHVKLSGC